MSKFSYGALLGFVVGYTASHVAQFTDNFQFALQQPATMTIKSSVDNHSAGNLSFVNSSESLDITAEAEPAPVQFVPQRLFVYSFADRHLPQMCNLVQTIAHFGGGELRVLGYQSESFFDGTSCGAKCKMSTDVKANQVKKLFWLGHLFENYEKQNITDDDLVLFTDAFDVLFQRPLSEVKTKFEKLTGGKRGIIFNGEPTCADSFAQGGRYGDYLRKNKYMVQLRQTDPARAVDGVDMCGALAAKALLTSPLRGTDWGLNSGSFVGDARSLRQFFKRIAVVRDSMSFERDQVIFQTTFVRYPEINVMVDATNELFLVVNHYNRHGIVEHFDAKGCHKGYMKADGVPGKVINYGEYPMLIHFAGRSKGNMYSTCVKEILPFTKNGTLDGGRLTFVDVDHGGKRTACPLSRRY